MPEKVGCSQLTKGAVWIRGTHVAGAAGSLLPACEGCEEICLASRAENHSYK